jgi:hypothetical protein
MPRPQRIGRRICSRCKTRFTPTVYRTYCDECYREYEAERRARRLAALLEGSAEDTTEKERRRRAIQWQEQNERVIIEKYAEINPAPGGYAITAPGKFWKGS